MYAIINNTFAFWITIISTALDIVLSNCLFPGPYSRPLFSSLKSCSFFSTSKVSHKLSIIVFCSEFVLVVLNSILDGPRLRLSCSWKYRKLKSAWFPRMAESPTFSRFLERWPKPRKPIQNPKQSQCSLCFHGLCRWVGFSVLSLGLTSTLGGPPLLHILPWFWKFWTLKSRCSLNPGYLLHVIFFSWRPEHFWNFQFFVLASWLMQPCGRAGSPKVSKPVFGGDLEGAHLGRVSRLGSVRVPGWPPS